MVKKFLSLIAFCCLTITTYAGNLRRPISPEQPAWFIHIDVRNNADPQKIIEMVPEDVRPFVIFNIATSSDDRYQPSGPAIYDSWMKVCAQNRVWTMIQCASGAHNRLPDTPDDLSDYEKYFREYPNFLGFHFAEQFWDFGAEGYPTFPERLQLFAKLLPLCQQYGGYLAASFTDGYYNASKMPMAWMKRNSDIKDFLAATPEYFLCFEKFTQKKAFYEVESNCLGQWLGGYAGQYGIRFDSSGWISGNDQPDSEKNTKYTKGAVDFVRAAGAIPVAEHMMLTGQTMMDGPELIFNECSKEGATTTVDGYKRRNWEWQPQFEAVSLSLFRKVLDGTIRILSREEVISRTKVCVVNDRAVSNVNNENENAPYLTPVGLFDGLYRFSCDQGGRDTENHWIENRWWTKSTGRYPTIPQVYAAPEGLTAFNVSTFNKTDFDTWMSHHFATEYTGDIYAARSENGWVTYNPYQYDDVTSEAGVRTLGKSTKRATGNIPFQYNTCESVDLDYAPYSLGIMKEYQNKVTFYLQNYEGGTDVIKINGATAEPTYTVSGGTVTKTWADNVLTLTIEHSGAAVELTVNCAGSATGRSTEYTEATITAPAIPAVYQGQLQYEAELADYKDATIQKEGYNLGHDGYLGQGYAELSNGNKLRFQLAAPKGYYLLKVRYQAGQGSSLTVNSSSVALSATTEWAETEPVALILAGDGRQVVDLAYSGTDKAYIDCVLMELQAAAVIDEAKGTPAVLSADLQSADITYQRALTPPTSENYDVEIHSQNKTSNANLYTICLPYKPTVSEGLKFYTLHGLSGTTLVFEEVAEPVACTPYLVAVTEGTHQVGSNGETTVDFTAAINDSEVHDGYQLKGTLTGLGNSDAQGCYVLQAGNHWGRVTTENVNVYIPPFRAYIVSTSAASSAPLQSVLQGNGTTAIDRIYTKDNDGTERWYNLSGQPVVNPAKGLYIVNGKKIILK